MPHDYLILLSVYQFINIMDQLILAEVLIWIWTHLLIQLFKHLLDICVAAYLFIY